MKIKTLIIAVFFLLSMLIVNGCFLLDSGGDGLPDTGDTGDTEDDGEDDGTGTDGGDTGDGSAEGRDWTYMVYMGADNNLSYSGLQDLDEMESVGSDGNLAIVLQAEFSDYYTSGVPTETLRFLVQDDGSSGSVDLNAGTSIGNVDMADPSNLTDFIRWARTRYPAAHYALVIWDHGAGWKRLPGSQRAIRGAVQDETSGTFMSLPDLAAGVRDAGLHFDIVNFDACLMGMYEVVYEFRGLTDYLVFSEETEPGEGDPYNDILGLLKADPGMSALGLSQTIVERYDAFYSSGDRGMTTKSAVNMSDFDELDEALLALASTLKNDASTISVVQAAQTATQDYAYTANHDIYDFCSYLVNNLPDGTARSAAQDLMSSVQGMVVANRTNPDSGETSNRGLAFYLPTSYETNATDLALYAQLACNGSRSSSSGTWGSYVEHLVTESGGGVVQYAQGGFAVYLLWTDEYGGSCNADLDLYIWEPAADFSTTGNGQWYAPYEGQTTPNGFFSLDSADSGVSEEFYYANSQVYWGDYYFCVNFYGAGSCPSALARLFIYDPAYGDWYELTEANVGFSLEYPSPQVLDLSNPYSSGCTDNLCLNNYSNWWVPDVYWTARSGGTLMQGNELPIDKGDSILFKYGKGSPLSP